MLAIIPARGGSKAVPRKNLALVAGKPLISYTIDAALAVPDIDRVIVSTDSPEIADVSSALGAEVPFLRPAELAADETPGIDPLIHALQWLEENQSYQSDYVLYLQPTSPLRTTEDIVGAMNLARQKNADAVIGVTPVEHHPYWVKRIDEVGRINDFQALEASYPRRQDLPDAYALNGAIFLARCEMLLRLRTWYTERTYAYVMPPERSLDIDSKWHLYMADLILNNSQIANSRQAAG